MFSKSLDGYFIFCMIIDVGSKILFSSICTLAHDLEFTVTDLEMCVNKNVEVCQIFKTVYFLNPQMDIFSRIIDVGPKFIQHYPQNPAHDLEFKVMDLEILCESFCIKVFKIS